MANCIICEPSDTPDSRPWICMWCKDADRQDELIPVALAARAYIEASSDQTVAAYRELEKAVRIMWGANR